MSPPGLLSAPRGLERRTDPPVSGLVSTRSLPVIPANRTKACVWGTERRHVPAPSGRRPYKDDFRRVAERGSSVTAVFSLAPTAFTPRRSNRATAQTTHEAALDEGLAPLMGWVKRLVDSVIQNRMGHRDL